MENLGVRVESREAFLHIGKWRERGEEETLCQHQED
jgi:hypothetical protein